MFHSNIRQAYKQVKQNEGVAGIDQIPAKEFVVLHAENGKMRAGVRDARLA
ncbi:MAG: hypothetical protein GXX92_10390 [Clostridiales bacterium]|nr:hypothetical protein [Clostridiales bacterium]